MDLIAITDKLQLVRSSAAAIESVVNYIESVKATGAWASSGSERHSFASAATGDILAVPTSANNFRTLRPCTWRNKDAALACDLTVLLNENATLYEIHKDTLQPGWLLEWTETLGFMVVKPALNDNRLITNVEPVQRVFRSILASHSSLHTFVTISGTAYYVYIGRVTQDITPKFVEFHITGAGVGTDTKEVGLFSTPAAPNKSAQTLTKIVATGTVDAGTSTGAKRNTAAFTTLIPKGTHLWAAMRTALATTQPTIGGLASDTLQGNILTTTGGGALTGVTIASGGIVGIATATVAPDISVVMD